MSTLVALGQCLVLDHPDIRLGALLHDVMAKRGGHREDRGSVEPWGNTFLLFGTTFDLCQIWSRCNRRIHPFFWFWKVWLYLLVVLLPCLTGRYQTSSKSGSRSEAHLYTDEILRWEQRFLLLSLSLSAFQDSIAKLGRTTWWEGRHNGRGSKS